MLIIFKNNKKHIGTAFDFPLEILFSVLLVFAMLASIFYNYHHDALAFPATPPAISKHLPNNLPNVSVQNASALVDKGNAFFDLRNYAQAIQYYDKALAIDQNYKNALSGKGDAHYTLANDTHGYNKAMQYYDKALSIDPSYKNAITGKGSALYSLATDTQGYEKAMQYFDKALAIDPNYRDAL